MTAAELNRTAAEYWDAHEEMADLLLLLHSEAQQGHYHLELPTSDFREAFGDRYRAAIAYLRTLGYYAAEREETQSIGLSWSKGGAK